LYTVGRSDQKLFCYYSSYSQNRPDVGKFLPEDINAKLCTHIIFAFADIIQGSKLKASGWNDLENGQDAGMLIPPPMRICFRRCLSVFFFLLATLRKNCRTHLHEIFREGWQCRITEQSNNQPDFIYRFNFGGDPDHRLQGLFSGFVTVGRYGKWLTDINLLLMLIRQIAALVRRALAEVCPVSVLLVYYDFMFVIYGLVSRSLIHVT